MNKKAFEFLAIGILTLLAVFVIGIIGYNLIYALTSGTETITIKEKWVKYKGEDAKYLISSEDGQVFQITDSFVKWRFDSSNLYAELEEKKTYEIETQGWRFGFLSDYKNIIKANLKGGQ